MRNFYYRAGATVPVEADLCWVQGSDGLCITAGTLPGNGFTCGRGITVPEEIDGVPVTALDISWSGPLDFIDGPNLKRAAVRITPKASLFSGSTAPLSFGNLYAPLEFLSLTVSGALRIGLRCDTLKQLSVAAPDIRLGKTGFSGCPNLETVSFHGTVNADPDWDWSTFPGNLFRNCRLLTDVSGTFRDGYLGSLAFADCVSLVNAPSLRVLAVGEGCFRNCTSLRTVHLANGMHRIDSNAFGNCQSLEEVYIPDTVTSLGSSVFQDCSALRKVHIPGGLTAIPDYCFYSCHHLGKVFLPDGITAIGDGAFADCPRIRDPWMPGHLESIGTRAFYGCVFTRPVTIPASVKKIGPQAFGASSHVQIRGVPGSEAERYARKNRLTFIPMEDPAP